MTSTWSEDTFGTPVHYKNGQLSFSPHMLPNFDFFEISTCTKKISFCQNQHRTDDFSAFFEYELYFLVPILTQKRLQFHRKMPLGPPFTTKLITLLIVNKRFLILNFEYSTFSKKYIFVQNQHSTVDFNVFFQYEL